MSMMSFFRHRADVCKDGINKVHFENKDKYIKMTIDEDIALEDYSMAIKLNGIDLKTFVFGTFWNDEKQVVNGGTYYNFNHNDRKYNIAITKEQVLIDESTPLNTDTIEKKLIVYKNAGKYDFFRCVHDEIGSTHNMEYFTSRNEEFLAKKMSSADVDEDLKSVFANLETFESMQEIDGGYDIIGKGKKCIGKSYEMID